MWRSHESESSSVHTTNRLRSHKQQQPDLAAASKHIVLNECFSSMLSVLRRGYVLTDKSAHVKQLNQRHASLAWWARMREQYPMGLIPVTTAARVLGVTHRRVYALIEEGRLRLVDDMPGGNDRDRFIPFTDLLDAPYGMTRGRPGLYGPKNRPNHKHEKKMREYVNTLTYKDLDPG